MKIFLDTADVAEIREYAASGLVDGVTTNPSLAAKTGRDYVESLKEICSIVPGAVKPAEVEANARLMQLTIPAALWMELRYEGLLESGAPVPGSRP